MATQAIYYEAGENTVSQVALTDNGDHKYYRTAHTLLSRYPGHEPVIRPNGLISGGIITPAASGSNDKVDVSAVNLYLNGVDKTGTNQIAAATDVAFTRGVSKEYMKISIVVLANGTIDAIEGTEGDAFSDTFGAAGGPPLIAVDAVLIGQVWITDKDAAVVSASEVKQVPGYTQEMANYPAYQIRYAYVTNGSLGYAGVNFLSALQLGHTGPVTKKVYAAYSYPVFAALPGTRNFDAPKTTGSVTSEKFYDMARGGTSTSLSAGSFEYTPTNAVSDSFLQRLQKTLFFKYYPDELASPYMICQATPFESGNHPADGLVVYTIALVAAEETQRVYA